MGIVVEISRVAPVPPAVAFAYVDDHNNVPRWLFGISRFEPIGEPHHGLGTVYDGVMHLGVKLSSHVKVIEWEQDRRIVLDSVKGFRNTSTWHFEPDAGGTRVTGRVEYTLPFGPAGKAIGKAIEPFVQRAVNHSSDALHEQLSSLA